MKSKSMLLMAVSLGFGLVAAIGISQVMGRNNQSQTEVEQTKPVMVALSHLDVRTELTEATVAIEQWPAELVPPDAISSFDEVTDKLLNGRVAHKMPILKQMVVNRSEINQLAVPPGMKVVGIRLPPDDLIGGLLTPGDIVDLIGVFTSKDNNKVSRTFLTSVQVFSIDNKTAPELKRGEGGSSGAIVGVLLNKAQAEQLILAQNVAQIKLVLSSNDRARNSTSSNGDDGFSNEDWNNPLADSQPEPSRSGPDLTDIIGAILKGTTNPQDTHTVVMVTPDGPTSYVFHKDLPLPQKIDGYFTPPSKFKPEPGMYPPSDLPLSDDFSDIDGGLESPVSDSSDLKMQDN